MFACMLFFSSYQATQTTAVTNAVVTRKLLMDEMCKRSDRDFPGLQALEAVVDGILARAKEERLKPVTLIDSWETRGAPFKTKRKVGFCWYVFGVLLAVYNMSGVVFFPWDLAIFLVVLSAKTLFLSLSLSLAQCEHSGSFFFVLQLIGFHTCKRYYLQDKEHYIYGRVIAGMYTYSAKTRIFVIMQIHFLSLHNYVGFINNTMYVIILIW